jgi:hypothetical protein
MKHIKKFALGALMMAGAAIGVAQPASAGVHVGIGIGIPGPAYYGPAYACDPYYDYYDEYGCGAYYSGPVFIDGVWINEPVRWRWWGGHRQFWWHGGWRVGSGFREGGFHGRGFNPGMHGHFRGNGFRGGFHDGGFHGHFGGGPGGGSHFGGGGHFGGGSGGGHGHFGGGGGSHPGGMGHHH